MGGDRPHPDWYHRVVRLRRRTAPHVEDEDRHQRAERGRARLGCRLRATRFSTAEWWCGSVDSSAGAVEPGAEDALRGCHPERSEDLLFRLYIERRSLVASLLGMTRVLGSSASSAPSAVNLFFFKTAEGAEDAEDNIQAPVGSVLCPLWFALPTS